MNKVNHQKWLEKRGLLPKQIKARKAPSTAWRKEYSDSLKVDRSTADYDSTGLKGDALSCANRSIMSNLHKESEATRKAILEKAVRTAPLWNKGGYQYICDGTDLTDIGRKK